MNERLARILEGAALHGAQKSIEAALTKAQERIAARADLRRRVEVLEADVAVLKGRAERHTGWGDD